MTDEQNTKHDALIPSNERGLITPRSAGLAKRGLELVSSVITSQVGEIRCFKGHIGWVNDVKFSSNDQQLISVGEDRTTRLWDTQNGNQICKFVHDDYMNSISFLPDNRLVLLGCNDGTIRLWDISSGQEINRIYAYDKFFRIVVSHDGQFAATTGEWDGTICVWEIASGYLVCKFTGHERAVFGLGFAKDGIHVISGSTDGTIRLWRIGHEREIYRLSKPREFVTDVAFSPDTSYILSGHGNLLDPDDQVAMSRYGSQAAYINAEADCFARLWDTKSGDQLVLFKGHKKIVQHVAFSHHGHFVLTAARDKTIRLWETQSGREVSCFKTDVSGGISFSHNDRFAVSGGRDTVKLWKLPSPNL